VTSDLQKGEKVAKRHTVALKGRNSPAQMRHWASEFNAAVLLPIGRMLGGLECEALPDRTVLRSSRH